MARGRGRQRDDDEEEEEEAAREEQLQVAPPPEKPPPDFHGLLEERAPLLCWLVLGATVPALCASKRTRKLLSENMSLNVIYDFAQGSQQSAQELADARRLRLRDRFRLPQCPADAPCMYLSFDLRSSQLKRAMLNRRLLAGGWAPAIQWEECKGPFLKCRSDIELLDRQLHSAVTSVREIATPIFLEEPQRYRGLTRLELRLAQLSSVPEGVTYPQVRSMKVICRDALFAKEEMQLIAPIFPGLVRTHFLVRPEALLPLTGPGIWATPDLRISVLKLDQQEGVRGADRKAGANNFFVAAHMFALPFNWQGQFFSQVVRLQMNELNEDHFGFSIDRMMEVLQSLPHLRRLGTLSLKAASLLNFAEGCPLEELVMTLEMEDAEPFFRMWLPVEEKGRRSQLRRLSVHLVASHGCRKTSREEEAAICSGWYSISSTMLHPSGITVLSAAHKQIFETALFQMPWHEPTWLSLDRMDYSDGRIPRSTPVERELRHCCKEFMERPGGSLITGPMRPGSEVDGGPGAELETTGNTEPRGPRRSIMSVGQAWCAPACAPPAKEWLMKFGDAVGVLNSSRR